MASLHVDAQTKRWVIRYHDESGKRRTRRTKFKGNKEGRRLAEREAYQLESVAEQRRLGIAGPELEYARLPVSEHLQDFEVHLKAKGGTAKHQRQLLKRLRLMIKGMGVTRITDIRVEAAERALVQLTESGVPDSWLQDSQLATEPGCVRARRTKPFSAKTRDDYFDSVRQFCLWLVTTGRLNKNPVGSIRHLVSRSDPEATCTFRRRALTAPELASLVNACLMREESTVSRSRRSSEQLEEAKLIREARALAYLLAATLGVRATQLCSIEWRDLDLEDNTLTLQAAHSKNGKEGTPDLPEWLAQQFRAWKNRLAHVRRAVPSGRERVFDVLPDPRNMSRHMAKDLEHAGIPRDTDDGRADFHAFRATAATQLYEANVDSKTAAKLLNVDVQVMHLRYAKLRKGRAREAVNSLPVPPVLPLSSAS